MRRTDPDPLPEPAMARGGAGAHRRTRPLAVAAALALAPVLVTSWGARADGPARNRLDKGMLLVASPGLQDSNFSRTVVLLTKHGADGAMGLVINRSSKAPISHAVPGLAASPRAGDKVFLGGPVGPNELFLLVQARAKPEEAQVVFGDVYLSRSHELLRALVKGDFGDATFRLYAGYAGWAPGQLEAELARGGWRVVPADADSVFFDEGRMWRRLQQPDPSRQARLHGIEPDRSTTPSQPGTRVTMPTSSSSDGTMSRICLPSGATSTAEHRRIEDLPPDRDANSVSGTGFEPL